MAVRLTYFVPRMLILRLNIRVQNMGPGRCLELDVGENNGYFTALVRYDYYSCIGKLLKNCGSTLMKALGGRIRM